MLTSHEWTSNSFSLRFKATDRSKNCMALKKSVACRASRSLVPGRVKGSGEGSTEVSGAGESSQRPLALVAEDDAAASDGERTRGQEDALLRAVLLTSVRAAELETHLRAPGGRGGEQSTDGERDQRETDVAADKKC